MALYLLTTARLGAFYIIANTPNDAVFMLAESFALADYGYSDYRKVVSIEIIAEEIGEFPKGKPNFSSGRKLILPKTNVIESH